MGAAHHEVSSGKRVHTQKGQVRSVGAVHNEPPAVWMDFLGNGRNIPDISVIIRGSNTDGFEISTIILKMFVKIPHPLRLHIQQSQRVKGALVTTPVQKHPFAGLTAKSQRRVDPLGGTAGEELAPPKAEALRPERLGRFKRLPALVEVPGGGQLGKVQLCSWKLALMAGHTHA